MSVIASFWKCSCFKQIITDRIDVTTVGIHTTEDKAVKLNATKTYNLTFRIQIQTKVIIISYHKSQAISKDWSFNVKKYSECNAPRTFHLVGSFHPFSIERFTETNRHCTPILNNPWDAHDLWSTLWQPRAGPNVRVYWKKICGVWAVLSLVGGVVAGDFLGPHFGALWVPLARMVVFVAEAGPSARPWLVSN